MKKNIIIILIGFFGFIFNITAQTKVEEPVLATSSKTNVDTKKVTVEKKEQQELKSASKATTTVVKKKNSTPKKNNTSDTPQLGTMSKKEEK